MSQRVLYVHNSADLYGASRSLVRLMRTLDRQRFDPVVLLPADGPLATQIREAGAQVIIFQGLSVITRDVFRSWKLPFFLLRIPFSILRLSLIFRREKIDLVHTNTGVILSSGPAAWLLGLPHVWHIRDWFQEFRSFWKWYERYMVCFSQRIIAVSEAVADQFSNRKKVCVINNGFDPEEFLLEDPQLRPQFRQSWKIPPNAVVVGCVGRIKLVRKGQEVLLQAASILKQRGVFAQYLVVGAPFPGNESHLDALEKIVHDSGLTDSVIFTGEIADPRPAYAAMDLFVLPSAQPEPFGGVVMEAMGMGLPVIATQIGGSLEQVADGVTGYLVPPSDPLALADRLEPLLRNPDLRAAMGTAGRLRLAERFTVDGMVAKIVAVYDSCHAEDIRVAIPEAKNPSPLRQDLSRKPAPANPLTLRPARILFVNNSADIYGASRCLVRLIERLDPLRFDPIVLLPETGPLEKLLKDTGTPVIFFPELRVITRGVFRSWRLLPFLLSLPISIFALWRILRREKINLVHTNTGVILSAGPAAWLAGVPNVWHIRDWFQEFHFFWKYYASYIQFFSHQILAVSGPIAEQFPPHCHAQVVHDGFDLEEFILPSPDVGEKFRATHQLGSGPVIGCVGRIKLIRKGQETLIEAAKILKSRGVTAKYLIVGAPLPGNEDHLQSLHRLVRDHQLEDSVIFTGEISDARPAFAAMNIFVLPSGQPEPFGGVVMEAMGMSLPVIATNIGGSTEQIEDGVSGFLIPPADPTALADRLETLLADPSLCTRFGTEGRRRIANLFTLNEMVEKIVAVYGKCLANQ